MYFKGMHLRMRSRDALIATMGWSPMIYKPEYQRACPSAPLNIITWISACICCCISVMLRGVFLCCRKRRCDEGVLEKLSGGIHPEILPLPSSTSQSVSPSRFLSHSILYFYCISICICFMTWSAHSYGLRHRLTILIVCILLNCWANIELWLSYLHYSVCSANMTLCAMQIWGQQQLRPMFALYTVEPTPLPLKSGLWVVFPLVLVHKPLPLPLWDTIFHSILLAWPHIPDFEELVKI